MAWEGIDPARSDQWRVRVTVERKHYRWGNRVRHGCRRGICYLRRGGRYGDQEREEEEQGRDSGEDASFERKSGDDCTC